MFAWSRYRFDVSSETAEYRQTVDGGAGREVGNVGWSGRELVGFKLHLPSRVTFHNSPSKDILRGNIIVWEQALTDRQKGTPLSIDVKMDSDSILANTLVLFGGMIVLVAITFVAFIWFIRSRGSDSEVRSEK